MPFLLLYEVAECLSPPFFNYTEPAAPPMVSGIENIDFYSLSSAFFDNFMKAYSTLTPSLADVSKKIISPF